MAYTGSSDIDALVQPALDAYGEEIARHGQDFSQYPVRRCTCGFQPERQDRNASRSVGLHIAAANKRAEKVYDAAADAAIKQVRADRDAAFYAERGVTR